MTVDVGRTPTDALRSLKRYVAVALGNAWEVRMAREEGAFERPFARVTPASAAIYPSLGVRFVADITQPFVVLAYPLAGDTPDEALLLAQEAENALFRAFLAGVEYGHPLRVPFFHYTGKDLGEGGLWAPRDYMRASNVSTNLIADNENSRLYAVSCDVRLAWRRVTERHAPTLTPPYPPPSYPGEPPPLPIDPDVEPPLLEGVRMTPEPS